MIHKLKDDIFFFLLLLRNNASSNVTSTSSRALKECSSLDTENRKTKKNVAKMFEDGGIFYFFSDCHALKLKLTLKLYYWKQEQKNK